jgi:hypothetical protein
VRTRRRPMIELYGLAFLIGAIGTACAQDAKPAFPVMAPIEQYREASASAEIALATGSFLRVLHVPPSDYRHRFAGVSAN